VDKIITISKGSCKSGLARERCYFFRLNQAGQTMGARPRPTFKLEEACLGLLAGPGLTYALADVLQPGFTAAVRLLQQMS